MQLQAIKCCKYDTCCNSRLFECRNHLTTDHNYNKFRCLINFQGVYPTLNTGFICIGITPGLTSS